MLTTSTLAVLSVLFFPVSIVSSASVALVTLRRGAFEGLYIWASSGVIAGLLIFLLKGSFEFGLFFTLVYMLIFWLPVWIVSIVLRASRNLSLAVEIAVLMSVLAVVSFYMMAGDPAQMWKELLTALTPKDAPEDMPAKIESMSHFMTSVIALSLEFCLIFGLFLGRWWQANLYNPGGFKLEYLSLSAPPRLSMLCLIAVAIGLLNNGILAEIAWSASALMQVLFLVIGTWGLHAVLAKHRLGRFLVPMLYLSLFLLPPAVLLATIVGLADPWLDLRKIKSTLPPEGGQ